MPQREIKFRAWFIGDIAMKEPLRFNLAYDGETAETMFVMEKDPTFMYPFNVIMCDRDDWTVEQYTGLKDKNGVEIYEGDVYIQSEYPESNYVIAFKSGCFVAHQAGKTINDSAPLAWEIREDEDRDELLCRDAEWIEIIGNIHENANLIK